MAQIKKINIKGVEYDLAGSGSSGGGGVTIFTPIFPGTAVPFDNTTTIDTIYLNTAMDAAEVHEYLIGLTYPTGTFGVVYMDANGSLHIGYEPSYNASAIMWGLAETDAEPIYLFAYGPDEALAELGVSIKGWNPEITNFMTVNNVNDIANIGAYGSEEFNESIKPIISITPFEEVE